MGNISQNYPIEDIAFLSLPTLHTHFPRPSCVDRPAQACGGFENPNFGIDFDAYRSSPGDLDLTTEILGRGGHVSGKIIAFRNSDGSRFVDFMRQLPDAESSTKATRTALTLLPAAIRARASRMTHSTLPASTIANASITSSLPASVIVKEDLTPPISSWASAPRGQRRYTIGYRPAARDECSACRAIALPASIGANLPRHLKLDRLELEFSTGISMAGKMKASKFTKAQKAFILKQGEEAA